MDAAEWRVEGKVKGSPKVKGSVEVKGRDETDPWIRPYIRPIHFHVLLHHGYRTTYHNHRSDNTKKRDTHVQLRR